jgi:hypothetical protein
MHQLQVVGGRGGEEETHGHTDHASFIFLIKWEKVTECFQMLTELFLNRMYGTIWLVYTLSDDSSISF